MEQKYIRKGHIIYDMDNRAVFTGMATIYGEKVPSINAAKRESRRLQGTSLGQGLLRVG